MLYSFVCLLPVTTSTNFFFALDTATLIKYGSSAKSDISSSTVDIIIFSFSLPWNLCTVEASIFVIYLFNAST